MKKFDILIDVCKNYTDVYPRELHVSKKLTRNRLIQESKLQIAKYFREHSNVLNEREKNALTMKLDMAIKDIEAIMDDQTRDGTSMDKKIAVGKVKYELTQFSDWIINAFEPYSEIEDLLISKGNPKDPKERERIISEYMKEIDHALTESIKHDYEETKKAILSQLGKHNKPDVLGNLEQAIVLFFKKQLFKFDDSAVSNFPKSSIYNKYREYVKGKILEKREIKALKTILKNEDVKEIHDLIRSHLTKLTR